MNLNFSPHDLPHLHVQYDLSSWASGLSQTVPLVSALSRRSLMLKLPGSCEQLARQAPGVVPDASGNLCLLVLPADKPARRQEAQAVEQLLAMLLDAPLLAGKRCDMGRAVAHAWACNTNTGWNRAACRRW